MRGKKHILLKTGIAVLVALLLLGLLLFAALFVVARGPSGGASARLCATMTEQGFPFTDIFFTTGEISRSVAYLPPRSFPDGAEITEYEEIPDSGAEVSGRYWKGFILALAPGSASRLKKGTASGAAAALGLAPEPEAVFTDGCLSYSGDSLLDRYCFCGMTRDGRLCAGSVTAPEAANSGYLWGISADRILIADGVLCADLGGGYAARAALGQRSDGTLLVFCAAPSTVYPCGITYDELASVMYGYGARTAVALSAGGGFDAGGERMVDTKTRAGYILTFDPPEGKR